MHANNIQGKGERNFHIFYYLLSGNDKVSDRETMQLTAPMDYCYLGGGPSETEDKLRLDDLLDGGENHHGRREQREDSAPEGPKKKEWAKNNVMHGKGFTEEQRRANALRDADQRKKAMQDRVRAGQVLHFDC